MVEKLPTLRGQTQARWMHMCSAGEHGTRRPATAGLLLGVGTFPVVKGALGAGITLVGQAFELSWRRTQRRPNVPTSMLWQSDRFTGGRATKIQHSSHHAQGRPPPRAGTTQACVFTALAAQASRITSLDPNRRPEARG